MAWARALNKPDPYCQCILGKLWPRCGRDSFQDHWWGSNSFSVLAGMGLQSMAWGHNSSNHPRQVARHTVSITLPSQTMLRWTPLKLDLQPHALKALVLALVKVNHSSLYFTFASGTSLGVQILGFMCKQLCKQIQSPTPRQAYQLFFQGLVSVTQLPQPDERPDCGQSSAL